MPWLLHIHTAITPENCLWRYPGIPEIKLYGVVKAEYGKTIADKIFMVYEGVPQIHPDIIGSVRVGAYDAAETGSDAELFTTPGSFFYDYDAGAIRLNVARYDNGVAVEGHQTPIGQRIAIGIIVGFCDAVDYARGDLSTYSGIFHDPRIKSLPTLSAKMDDLEYGFQAFNDWSIALAGVDGAFEGVNHTGCIAKLIQLPEGGELSDGWVRAYGRIQKTTDGDDYSVSVGDIRRNGENYASCGRFSKDDFPYLDDGDVGKVIPMYWNKQTAIEPICLNKTQDLSDSPTEVFRYCIGATPDSAHTIKRVDRVYSVGSDADSVIYPGFALGYPINTKLRRVDKVSAIVTAMAAQSTVIASGFSFETAYTLAFSASEIVSVDGEVSGTLVKGTDYTASGTSIVFHNTANLNTTGQKIVVQKKAVDLTEGTDFTTASDSDGFTLVTLSSGGVMSGNGYTVTVSASSDDNNGADIETDVPSWTATLHDATLGLAYISIPASIALSDGDSPMDIKVDLFGWHNQTAGETEWLNGADIIRDAIVMFEGYQYDSDDFDVQSWEIERVKCADKGIHVSPRIEDDTTINDLIGSVCKSTLMLCTNRSDGKFDLKVDSMDIYPQWRIETYERMETPSPSLDISSAFSSLKIQYGTSGDSDKKTYIDTTYEADIKAVNAISKTREIDTIISDEESAKQYAAMCYERVFDLDTLRTRDLIEIKIPAESAYLNMWPGKVFIAPRNRSGDYFAAYTILSMSRALGDEITTVTARKRYNVEFDSTYTQGVLCGDFICDGAIIGATNIDVA